MDFFEASGGIDDRAYHCKKEQVRNSEQRANIIIKNAKFMLDFRL